MHFPLIFVYCNFLVVVYVSVKVLLELTTSQLWSFLALTVIEDRVCKAGTFCHTNPLPLLKPLCGWVVERETAFFS